MKKQLINRYPELYSDLGLYVLNSLVIGAELSGEFKDQFEYTRHLILLIKCRQFGVEAAFAEIEEGRDDYWTP